MEEDNNSSTSSTLSFCPSFNSYTTDKLAIIATRITEEETNSKSSVNNRDAVNGDNGDDFVFDSVVNDCELFSDGQIRPLFPIFNRDLLLNNEDDINQQNEKIDTAELQFTMKELFIFEDYDDRNGGDGGGGLPSSSSSEADELETVPEGSYCVWSPKTNSIQSSPNQCKKSNSTGSSSSQRPSSSSKRWLKFRDLLKRSNSDGGGGGSKESSSFVFVNKTKNATDSKGKEKKLKSSKVKMGKEVSAHEAFYVKNRAMRENDKKRSYLPYRQDLFGLFVNVNSLGRTFPPF